PRLARGIFERQSAIGPQHRPAARYLPNFAALQRRATRPTHAGARARKLTFSQLGLYFVCPAAQPSRGNRNMSIATLYITLPRITLTLGALVGIAAFLHGIFVSGRTAARMKVVADQILATQGPPPPDKLKEAQALGAKLGSGVILTAAMGSIALILMAAAQTI